MMKKFYTWLILFLILFIFPVWANITAEYIAASPLHFEQGFYPLNTSKIVMHLGTLTISTDGEALIDPNLLNMNLSTQFGFTGPVWWSTGPWAEPKMQETYFHLWAFSTVNGVTQANPLYESDGSQPLRAGGGNLSVSEFVAELYLVGDQNWTIYEENATYTLTKGSLDTFTVAVAKGPSGFDNGGTLIAVNGRSPEIATSILPANTQPTDPIIYGAPPEQANYDFLITNKQAISLADAVGNGKAKVADAQITITNGQANKEYGVNIIFTNQANTNPFRLTMQNVNNPPTIPYSLFFNNQLVIPGGDNEWTGLKNGITKSLDIMVTGISADDANKALAGSYQDVIIVNISPLDT
jgi:hypothetical protein